MTAIYIIGGIVAYITVVAYVARRVAGKMSVAAWRSAHSAHSSNRLAEWHWGWRDETDRVAGSFALALFALPVALVYLAMNNEGGWGVAPREVRHARDRKRVEQLEAKLDRLLDHG